MSELGASHQDWLVPQLGDIDIGALMTTRRGGVSLAPYDSLNVRHGIGDFSAAVQRNQQILAAAIGEGPMHVRDIDLSDLEPVNESSKAISRAVIGHSCPSRAHAKRER